MSNYVAVRLFNNITEDKKVKKYMIYHIETCLPDYFGGHHLPVIQVLVRHNTTYKDIKTDLLCREQSIGHLTEDSRLGEDGIDYHAYDEAVKELFEGLDLDGVPNCCAFIEPVGDDDEFYDGDSVCMFFVINVIDDE